MGRSARSRTVSLLCAALLLLVPGCGGDPPEEAAPTPTRADLEEEIAHQAGVIPEFDEVRAIVVSHRGRVVLEQYRGTGPEEYREVQSITKSVVSTLIGIAVDEGLIRSVDEPLSRLLPGYADAMSPVVAGTTLRQLLTMTAGLPAGEHLPVPSFMRSQDWGRAILTTAESSPGTRFVYSNGTSHLLAAVLQEATGTSVLEYARSRLFEPLGIDTRPAVQTVYSAPPRPEQLAAHAAAGFAWLVDPQGVNTGWWGLKLRAHDLLKLGQLFLAKGRWGEDQVVSADWVAEATRPQVDTDVLGVGYGYQWWTGEVDGTETFQAMGFGGQLIEVVPDRDLVVVTSTEVRDDDVTSRGIDVKVLHNIVDDAIAGQFPAR